MSGRKLKKQIHDFLAQDDITAGLDAVSDLPEKQAVNPLFSFLHSSDPLIKWHAVTAMGMVLARLADREPESARVIMRRLMWNLNDESGGIGWGSPEAMGEILARQNRLADEYHTILVSYIDPEGNFIEYEILQRGVLWGIGRLSHARKELMKNAAPLLLPYLDSADPHIRGLAGWTSGLYFQPGENDALAKLAEEESVIMFYYDLHLKEISIGDLVKQKI